MSSANPVTLEKLVALCKRRGFVYQAAEIYGGLNGVYDYGHLGTLLKQNITSSWRMAMQQTDRGDMLLLDGSLLGPYAVWEASGHVQGFHDPMVDCLSCKHRYRADDVDLNKACPHCGNKNWTDMREFNMMFQTNLGAATDKAAIAFLRPETAQTIYINFKNIISTNRVKLPFGVAQIGKAFRNEITPKQFLFRMREFEQMEMEWFCKPETAAADFEYWVDQRIQYFARIGVKKENLRRYEQKPEERAHYSSRTIDIEYNFPFGWKELEGIANRGDYDLSQHTKFSGKELGYFDESVNQTIIPYVVESSVGVDRLFLTLLFDSYTEDVVEGEERTMLKLHPRMAPIKAALLPLMKKLSEPVEKLYTDLKQKGYSIQFDETGSIGKRYRRQDEIGTPACFTYDFESEKDNCMTARDRDTTKQERIGIDKIESYIKDLINK
jgi:glycyl-tRNA synthetase